MAKHARTTITVPADLKARMEAVSEPVNWSAIACAAFEQKLAEITKRRGAKDMKEVIDRLRASKKKHENEQYEAGREAGQSWAKDDAEAEELIRLEKLHDSLGTGEWAAWFTSGGNDAYGVSERFVFQIQPLNDGDRREARWFWEARGFEEYPDEEIVQGFAEGALEVWDQVKSKL